MEQEYGEQRAATSLAGRTVLPGEPFDPPAASAVPGPRDTPPQQQAPEPAAQWNYGTPAGQYPAPMPPGSYEPAYPPPSYPAPDEYPAPPAYPAATGLPAGATYATADSLAAAQDYDALHQDSLQQESLQQYAALPVTEGYGGPAQYQAPQTAPPAYPAPEYPAPTYGTDDPPAYPAPAAPSWPASVQQPVGPQGMAPAPQAFAFPPQAPSPTPVAQAISADETDGAHRKGKRKAKRDAMRDAKAEKSTAKAEKSTAKAAPSDAKPGPNKALIAVAAVVVLGGAGYFGYTQLSKSDDSSNPTVSTPVTPNKPATPATPVTPRAATPYLFPSTLAGFPLRTGPNSAALVRQLTSFAKTAYPASIGTPSIASYGTSANASVVVETFHPASNLLLGGFNKLLSGVRKPATGNVVGSFTLVPAGAAGGKMACGAQRGASPITTCIWQGQSTVGMLYMKGTTNTPAAQALTRELRAFGER